MLVVRYRRQTTWLGVTISIMRRTLPDLVEKTQLDFWFCISPEVLALYLQNKQIPNTYLSHFGLVAEGALS